MAKRQKSTPLIERDQNVHDDAGKRKAAAQAKKMAVKTREVSSVTAMQEMQTSMTMSRNFQNSLPSTTQASTQQQAKDGSSEVSTPVVVSGLEMPTAQLNNGQQRNAIVCPGQHQAKERSEARTSLVVTGLQTPTTQNKGQKENGIAITQHPGEHQSRERSEARTSLVVTGLQTPTTQNKGQKENAISQHPGQHKARERSEARTSLVVTGLQTPTTQNKGQKENTISQHPGQHKARERSEARTSLVVTGLQTPTTQNKGQKKNAISQHPGQHQARERSEARNPLVVTDLGTPNAEVRGGSCLQASSEIIAEDAFFPDSVTVTPATEVLQTKPVGRKTPAPNSPVISDNTLCYDVWRSSMTALLEMEDDEFEQMSDLTSAQAKCVSSLRRKPSSSRRK